MDFASRTHLGRFEPNADVFIDEERGAVVVTVELAGADPESLHVGLDERHLVLTGRRLDRTRMERGSFAQKEIAYGEFGKRIHLPVAVQYENAEASYADGVLVIRLPISPTAYMPTARTELHIMVQRIHS